MADKDIYLLDENGKPQTTADGTKMRLDYFDNDPTDDAPDPTDEEVDADIETLGLSEFLPDEAIEEDTDKEIQMGESRQIDL